MLVEILLLVVYFIALYFAVFYFFIFFDNRKEEKSKLRQLPPITVIIPAYNEEECIAETINSLLKLDYSKDKVELIVVNDGSTDNTAAVVKKFRSVKLINQENQGKGAALNNGIRHSKGELIACLDADSVVGRDALKNMVVYFADENVAAVTPLLQVYKPKTFLQKIQKYEYILSLAIKRLISYINAIYVTPGPFSIYRKSVVNRIGGFDEHSLVEDQELAFRLQKNYYVIKQTDKGSSYSYAPKNLRDLYGQRNRWNKGTILNFIKYRKIFLNKDYGDFGLFQMPKILFDFMAVLFFVFTFSYFFIRPLVKIFYNFVITGFDFTAYFKYASIHTSFGYSSLLFFIAFLIASAFFMLVYGMTFVGERFNKSMILPTIGLFFVYPFILSFIYLVVCFELIIGKIQRW